jgi:hypothetical protein
VSYILKGKPSFFQPKDRKGCISWIRFLWETRRKKAERGGE